MSDETPPRKFGKMTCIGGGVMLDPESQTYTPYRWMGEMLVTGKPEPYPTTSEEMDRLQTMADGLFVPPFPSGPVEYKIEFTVSGSVVSNDGSGYHRDGVPISDQEAQELWRQYLAAPSTKLQKEDS